MIDFKKKLEEEEGKSWTQEAADSAQADELLLNNKKRNRVVTYTIAVIVIALIFSGKILISSQKGTDWLPNFGLFIKHLVPGANKTLKGEEGDRVNILLLGIGGEGHDGAYLTDTMILASFQPSTKSVALISVPRDLITPVSDWRKINSIDAYAEQKTPGSGGEVTAQAISQLLQIPVDYYIRADFNGFENIINELGGIQINVENTLDDYSYPILGQEENPNYYARFEHLHFDKGLQTMNGTQALAYTRSRHAAGSEGSDFARARRQQLILEAVKNKLLSSQTLLNPITLTKISGELMKNIATNINSWEALRLWELFHDTDQSHISNKVLSDAPDGFLVSGRGEDGAYILTPRSGNFSDIRNFVQNIFSNGLPATVTPKLEVITGSANLQILNGTWVSGLASKYAVILEQSRFTIQRFGNAAERNYSRTMIYDLTGGQKNNSLGVLKRLTGGTIGTDQPTWLNLYRAGTSTVITGTSTIKTGTSTIKARTFTPDFILILGTDANKAE